MASAGLRGGFEDIDYALGLSWKESDSINTRPDLVHTPDTEGFKKNLMQMQVGYDLNKAQRLEARFMENRVDARSVPWGGGNDTTGSGLLSTSSVRLQSQWFETIKTTVKLSRAVSAKKDSAPNDYATTLEGASLDAEYKGLGGTVTGLFDERRDVFDAKPTKWDPAVVGGRSTSAIGLGYGAKLDNHAVQVNVRNDQDSIFGSYQTGALSYAYIISVGWRISASIGNAFRAPTLEQVFGPYGSTQLQPEKSRNTEISVDHAVNNASVKATVFRNNFENMISSSQFLSTCTAGGFCWYNVGKASVEGFSLSGAYDWKSMHFYGATEWLNPKNEITGQTLVNRARRVITLGMETTRSDWTYGADIKDTGERFDNSDGLVILPSYTLLNVYFTKKLNKDWQWKTRFDNVADVKYQHINKLATPGATLHTSIHWTP
jgi:vitamin B12 transporter